MIPFQLGIVVAHDIINLRRTSPRTATGSRIGCFILQGDFAVFTFN